MKLLIANDDGVYAAGIAALANSLKTEHQVVICAPAAERSGASHSITFMVPLVAEPVTLAACPDVRAYSIAGTPADCVRLGYSNLEPDIDMVISGINHGSNVGRDVLYSGTVSAAMEAAAQGIPALAVSIDARFPQHLEAAARAAVQAVNLLQKQPLPPGYILNLNVPDLPEKELKGIRTARLGHMADRRPYERRVDPYGRTYYWIPGHKGSPQPQPGTDVALMKAGYITLTPLCIDWAREESLRWAEENYVKEMHHGEQ